MTTNADLKALVEKLSAEVGADPKAGISLAHQCLEMGRASLMPEKEMYNSLAGFLFNSAMVANCKKTA